MKKPTLVQFARKCINDKNIELTQVDYDLEVDNGCPTGNIIITVKAKRLSVSKSEYDGYIGEHYP
jgi:hypothetical protein